jgi:N-acetyl-anhydromuramyl-L-alanine amidase AmpD
MDIKFETDKFPFVQAKFFKKVQGRRKVRVIVMHTIESSETTKTAENTAHFFQITTSPASAHLCVDSDSIIQCVLDNDVAAGAPGVNRDGIHIEQAGRAEQTRAEWLDDFGKKLLEMSANAAAQYCLKYDIPVKKLTDEELRDGKKGIIGHVQASHVFKPNQGHFDPGPNFPWDVFIPLVQRHFDERLKKFQELQVVA